MIKRHLGVLLLFLLGLAPVVIIPPGLFDFAPLSLVTIIPAFLAGRVVGAMAGAAIAPALYIFFRRKILKGTLLPSTTALVMFVIFVVLAYVSGLVDFNNTVLFTSLRRAIALSLESLIPPIILIGVFLWIRNQLTVKRSLALHWFALAWLTWSAIPWWGELL
jgi:hypothetical protein